MKKIIYFLIASRFAVVVFVSGAVGMVLELVGSRIVAPYFGNSLFVWTSLIGVILGSLSLGYYFGGILADKKPDSKVLSKIVLLAALFIAAIAFFKEPVLQYFLIRFNEVRISSLLSVIALFAAPSVLLGSVSPYVVKLKVKEIDNAGKAVGTLYAISTAGSIVGTFLAGFFLIPWLGNTELTFLLAVVLVFLSLYISLNNAMIVAIGLVLVLFSYKLSDTGLFNINAIADIDTQYSRVLIREVNYRGKDVRVMTTDNMGSQSGIYTDGTSGLVFDYINSYRLDKHFHPKIENALMIGGAGYTYPSYFAENYKNAKLDVVEIDPEMTKIAKQYFNFRDYSNINVYHQDASTYMKKNMKKYDVVYVDAFNAITPPYYLTTKEFFTSLNNSLTENGIIMLNLLGSPRGNNLYYNAQLATLKSIFPFVGVIPLGGGDEYVLQNNMVIAFKNGESSVTSSCDRILGSYLSRFHDPGVVKNSTLLTDDYAPVEYLTRNYLTNHQE